MSGVSRQARRDLRRVPGARGRGLTGIARRLVFRALGGITIGSLELVLPDGGVERFGDPDGDAAVRVRVRSNDAFRRIATRGRVGFGEGFVARDWETDDLVGFLSLIALNLDAARSHGPLRRLDRIQRRLRPVIPRFNGLRRAKENIHYHYDLGNELYRLFLDDSLTYSSAIFEHPGESLEQAQENKYRRICEKLHLEPGQSLLEIGCGWGGFALHAAAHHDVRVTAVTISREQHDEAIRRVREAGLSDRITILYRDYRELEGSFDRIASIEMFEAIGERQFATFFTTVDRLLARDGLACIQTIAVPDDRYETYRRSTDWIQEYIFPGGFLPSATAFSQAMTRSSRLQVHHLEDIGAHYADTLRLWRGRFWENIDAVRALGYDDRFERIWTYYLAFCEAGFRTRALRDLQLVLTRPMNAQLPQFADLKTEV